MSDELDNLIKDLKKVNEAIKQSVEDLKALIKDKNQIETEIRALKR